MAFQNNTTAAQVRARTTGERISEDMFRGGLDTIIEKADRSIRDIRIGDTVQLRDGNDVVTLDLPDSNDPRIPSLTGYDVPQELVIEGGMIVARDRVPFSGAPSFPLPSGQQLFTVGDPVRSTGTVLPRLIPNPNYGQFVIVPHDRNPRPNTGDAQFVVGSLGAEQASWPVYEDYWLNNNPAPAGNFDGYSVGPVIEDLGNRGEPQRVLGRASTLFNDYVQRISNNTVSGSVSNGPGSDRVNISLSGLTPEFVAANPLLFVVLRWAGWGSPDYSVWALVNLTDFSLSVGVQAAPESPPDRPGLPNQNRVFRDSGAGNPGVIVNDVDVPAVAQTLTLRPTGAQELFNIGTPSGTTLPTTVPDAGRIFVLTQDSGMDMAGIYFSDGNAWVRS